VTTALEASDSGRKDDEMTAAVAGLRHPGSRWQAIGAGLTIAGLAYVAMVHLRIAPYAPPVPDYGPMFDARAYWTAFEGGMYDTPWGVNGAYSYSPAFAQLVWPLTLLPWGVFASAWTLAAIGCLFWMRVPWMIAFPGVVDDILRGNIHVFLATMVVIGFRYPGAYVFGVIAKGTPGLGLAWYAVRREWRPLAIALAVIAAVAGLSFALTSSLWFEWFDFLSTSTQTSVGIQLIPLPLAVRIPIAVAIVAIGALTNRAWLVPIGVMVGLPNVWTSSTALLAAVPALWKWRPDPAGRPGPEQ
jgi:hypothetical protein